MDPNIVKGKPLTKDEIKFLLELIENSRIITTKSTNATNNKLKNEEWSRLADRFNALAANCPRTAQQLRLKWENLKKTSRKRTKLRMNQIKTGGGSPEYVPPDEILDRVTRLLGNTDSAFGGDKQPVGFDDVGDDESSGDGESSGDDIGDARVSLVESNNGLITIPLVNSVENVVTEYQVLDVVEENITSNETKRLTSSTPRAVKKKFKPDEGRTARNVAIAEYFSAKKQCIDSKLNNIHLENDSLKLRNIELKLKNEILVLEKKKLKLELEKFYQL